MKTQLLHYRSITFTLLAIIGISLITLQGCKKTVEVEDKTPTKFTELKIASNFKFQNFKNVEATITIPTLKSGVQSVV